jgi:hypothetical protein
MNVEIGTEAEQFPEKEYIKWDFVAVWSEPLKEISPLVFSWKAKLKLVENAAIQK